MQTFLKSLMKKKAKVRTRVSIPLAQGIMADFCSFTNLADDKEHLALIFQGRVGRNLNQIPLVRVHSECLTGDVFHSARCDCGEQLKEATERLANEGGILLYLRQEGRGIGLYKKLEAYTLQLKGQDTYEANQSLGLPNDLRDYRVAAQMLQALSVEQIRLLSNNPDKRRQLESHGVRISHVERTSVFMKEENKKYLQAKVEKTGHLIRLLAKA